MVLKMNLNLNHTPCMKINSKWVADLNKKCKTINFGGGKHRRKSLRYMMMQLFHLTPTTKCITRKTDKLTSIKIKNFCPAKILFRGWLVKLQTGRKYLQTTYATKNYYSQYIKNSLNSVVKVEMNHLENEQ